MDYGGKYWGAGPVVVGGSSKENAPHVEEVVQYRDTDNNGFIDEITYDYDGDKNVDLKISLLGQDKCDLIDPGELKWQGMHELFTKISEDSFQEALVLYRKNAGASSTWRLVCFLDSGILGLPVLPNGGDIAVTWHATGIFGL